VTLSRCAAVVLVGGQATRMGGGDKTLLPVGGRPMLDAVIAALDLPNIAISANGDPARFARYGLPVLPDGRFVGQGPLAGLMAGLDWAASLGMATLLTAPGDTPFLPVRLAEQLAPAPGCSASGGRRHHLVALWPLSCRVDLHMFLSVPGPRHVARFAEHVGMRYVDFPIQGLDPFANINTQAELTDIRLKAAMNATSGTISNHATSNRGASGAAAEDV
jgi:molybdenum cofactor guanylyltransferase